MIDVVAVVGVRRANERIPPGEIQQEIGRAGRSYTRPGEAVVICPPADEEYAWSCIDGEPPVVMSEMGDVEAAAFNVLPWLDRVHDAETYVAWMSRSLAFQQGTVPAWEDVEAFLKETGCVGDDGVTPFGELSVRSYCGISRMVRMQDKIRMIAADWEDELDPVTLSWALAGESLHVAGADPSALASYKSSARSRGCVFDDGGLVQGYIYHAMFTGSVPRWAKAHASKMADDLPRMLSVCSGISKMEGVDISGRTETYEIAVARRVPLDAAEAMRSIGVKRKSTALLLASLGVLDPQSLRRKAEAVARECGRSMLDDLSEAGHPYIAHIAAGGDGT